MDQDKNKTASRYGITTKPVMVWGTSLEAVQFTYEFKNIINIAGYIDNKGDYGEFCGKKVLRLLEISDYKKYFYIFAGLITTYENEIKSLLLQLDLKEFDNFIFYKWCRKQMILLHGNCHMDALGEALTCSSKFNDKYFIYKNKTICNYRYMETIDPDILGRCDLFIHEDIRPDNPFGYKLSDDYLVPKLKNCKNITVPHLFGLGKGFFPQDGGGNLPENKPLRNGRENNGMFPHRDNIIEQGLADGMSPDDIIAHSKEDVFTKEEIVENFNTYIDKIKSRESSWDIKVSSFIIDHYREEKLFYDLGHPTEIVIIYIAKKLLELLELDVEEDLTCRPLNDFEEPVYPCVKRALGLKWNNQYIRKGVRGRKFTKNMDLDEYIREYIQWCHCNN